MTTQFFLLTEQLFDDNAVFLTYCIHADMKKITARTQSRSRNDTGKQGANGVGHDRQCTGADMTSIYEMKYM